MLASLQDLCQVPAYASSVVALHGVPSTSNQTLSILRVGPLVGLVIITMAAFTTLSITISIVAISYDYYVC